MSDFERLVDGWFDAAKVRPLSPELRGQIEALRDELKRVLAAPRPKNVEFDDDEDLSIDLELYADAVAGVASHLLQAKFDVPEEWTVDDKRLAERIDAVLAGKQRAPVRKKAVALKERGEALARIGELERAIISSARKG